MKTIRNASVDENILLRFRRDDNGHFRKRIFNVDGAKIFRLNDLVGCPWQLLQLRIDSEFCSVFMSFEGLDGGSSITLKTYFLAL